MALVDHPVEEARRAHEQASLAVVLAARSACLVAALGEPHVSRALDELRGALALEEQAAQDYSRATLARIEAEAAVQALERGSEAAAARWALRAILAEPGWRGLARAILGDEPEVVVHGS